MLIICALAVYKMVQLVEAIVPREALPWLKIAFAVVLSVVVTLVTGLDKPFITAFAVATIAGIIHTVLRTITFVGDRYRVR